MGAGLAMSQAMGQSIANVQAAPPLAGSVGLTSGVSVCQKCGFKANGTPKFCPECGEPMVSPGNESAKCPFCKKGGIGPGVKFCPECGEKIVQKCPKCNADLSSGIKFCPDCGMRITNK
jgi:membrane protease subunit (stomatin/prohibitin family)